MALDNIIVLDLETALSADDCRHCERAREAHDGVRCDPSLSPDTAYTPISWASKPALGLSIGGYYSYLTDRIHWFDRWTLEDTVCELVADQPLMVSYNGIAFDFPLMRGLLRREAEEAKEIGNMQRATDLTLTCDYFKDLAGKSYDILAEIWRADPKSKYVKGLNSLDSVCRANGLGGKTGDGALAPNTWREGRRAQVLNYCADDIYKTKALFEKIMSERGYVMRSEKGCDRGIRIRHVDYGGSWHA